MSGEIPTADVNRSKTQQDYEYISNDPDENADNFDPKWACLRELTTDEERYQAIRKRWGNANIPDPQINLTCRQSRNYSESDVKENHATASCSLEADPASTLPHSTRNKKPRVVSRRRSRSCTRPYEELISNIEKNYQVEYSQLMFRQRAELQEMLQIQLWQICTCSYDFIKHNLKIQQNQEVIHLLSNHYNEVQTFLGKKLEHIDICMKYIEEVKAFFSFYQKINDDEVTLQMTEEQYEHTVETERMYSLYSKFYN